jgi:hypothetical protein
MSFMASRRIHTYQRSLRNLKANQEEVKMPSAILLRRLICLHLLVLLFFSVGQLAAQTEEKLLDDINQLPEGPTGLTIACSAPTDIAKKKSLEQRPEFELDYDACRDLRAA